MLKRLSLLLPLAMTLPAAVRIEKITYKGWPNSYRITNGEVELVVVTDIGPRIMRYAFVGGPNLFKEYPEMLGKSGESVWMIRGGHRLWRAPEDKVLSYGLDNEPASVEVKGDVLTVTSRVEQQTGLQKQISVKLAPSGSRVEIIHHLKNAGPHPQRFAAWALTVMAPGGTAIIGFPPRGKHPDILPPTNPLTMWAYTDFSDSRWRFTKKYLTLRQDPKAVEPQKTGLFNPETWGAYLLGTDLFLKRAQADPKRQYPDFGCSLETFTNADMLELETLGPLSRVPSGASVEHIEQWSLHRNVRVSSWTDAGLDNVLLPLLSSSGKAN
jgi:hypothetical protein